MCLDGWGGIDWGVDCANKEGMEGGDRVGREGNFLDQNLSVGSNVVQ